MEEFSLEMLEANEVNVGDVVTAEVLKNDDDKQFIVSLQGGYQAVLPVREIAEGDEVKVGDSIEVVVKRAIIGEQAENGSFLVSKKAIDARKAWDDFANAHNEGDTVEGTVKSDVRGGLVVDVEGARGFVPASLLSDRFVRNLKSYVGQTLNFVIEELKPEENRLVLNRKVLVSQERAAKVAEILAGLEVGQTIKGTVARLTNFGAFIDLGGIDGLVHISELSHDHVSKPADAVAVGEEVDVKVLEIDAEKGRVSLSIKATQPSPWDIAVTELAAGDVVYVTVKRITDFGAFVELFKGVEGLVHISQVSHEHIDNINDVLKPGEQVKVEILSIDSAARRIALSIKNTQPKPVKELTEEEKAEKEAAAAAKKEAAEMAKAVAEYADTEAPANNPFAALADAVADNAPSAEDQVAADEACAELPEM